MTCNEASGLLDRLMDGELTEEERRELEAHGQKCPECAEAIRATLQMKALFAEMEPEVDVPLAAQAKWRGAVKEAARQDRRRRFTRWIASAAAAVVVLVGVGVGLRGGLNPGQGVNKQSTVPQAVQEVADAAQDIAYESAALEEVAVNEPGAMAVIETDGASSADSALTAGAASDGDAASNEVEAGFGVAAPVLSEERAEEAAFESEMAEEASGAEDLKQRASAPMCAALAQQAPACELAICVDEVDSACGVIADLAEEFEGVADVQPLEDGGANVYVEIQAASAPDFLAAVAKLDATQNPPELPSLTNKGTVLVLLVVDPA